MRFATVVLLTLVFAFHSDGRSEPAHPARYVVQALDRLEHKPASGILVGSFTTVFHKENEAAPEAKAEAERLGALIEPIKRSIAVTTESISQLGYKGEVAFYANPKENLGESSAVNEVVLVNSKVGAVEFRDKSSVGAKVFALDQLPMARMHSATPFNTMEEIGIPDLRKTVQSLVGQKWEDVPDQNGRTIEMRGSRPGGAHVLTMVFKLDKSNRLVSYEKFVLSPKDQTMKMLHKQIFAYVGSSEWPSEVRNEVYAVTVEDEPQLSTVDTIKMTLSPANPVIPPVDELLKSTEAKEVYDMRVSRYVPTGDLLLD